MAATYMASSRRLQTPSLSKVLRKWFLMTSLGEHGDGEFHALAAIANSGTQEKRAQVLLHGAWADVQLARNFLVAAGLDQRKQNLLVAGGHFDFGEIDHVLNLPAPTC